MNRPELLGQLSRLPKSPGELPPLLLAYLGDAVFELYIRWHLAARGIMKPAEWQKSAVRYVSAPAQARALKRLEPLLTEEEKQIVKRGRNAKSGSSPKNASVSEYRHSTGLEALVGHLYCLGNGERIGELMQIIIESAETDEKGEHANE
jgi:ribonuclease-3 family protein